MEIRPCNSENEIKNFQKKCSDNLEKLEDQVYTMNVKMVNNKVDIIDKIEDKEFNLRVWIIFSLCVMIIISFWEIVATETLSKNVKELDVKITTMETKLDDLEIKADEVIKKLNTIEQKQINSIKNSGSLNLLCTILLLAPILFKVKYKRQHTLMKMDSEELMICI